MPPSLEKLDLSGDANNPEKFTGGIPTEWGSLTNLKELNMAYCGLDGTFGCRHPCAHDPRYATEANRGFLTRSPFPRCAGTIPESIGSLTSLQSLELKGNALSGA